MAAAYEVRSLTKRYSSPPVLANDGITFTVSGGEAFGLLGPNGAGKSTLVKQLVGLLRPTSGEIRLFGERLAGQRDRRVGRTVAYLPQGSLSLGELKVAEAVRWIGVLRGCSPAIAASETDDLLERLTISTLADRQLRKLSGGQRRLVQLGMTLIGHLPVLILDEPTADIDVALRQRIWDLVSERARKGSAVILVTHDVAEAERVLDRVAIIDQGRVVTSGTPAELKAGLAHRTRIEVVVAEGRVSAGERVQGLLPDARVDGRRVSAWVPAEEATAMLDKLLADVGLHAVEDVRLVSPSLEDVYLAHGRHSAAGSGEGAPRESAVVT